MKASLCSSVDSFHLSRFHRVDIFVKKKNLATGCSERPVSDSCSWLNRWAAAIQAEDSRETVQIIFRASRFSTRSTGFKWMAKWSTFRRPRSSSDLRGTRWRSVIRTWRPTTRSWPHWFRRNTTGTVCRAYILRDFACDHLYYLFAQKYDVC